MRGAITMNEYYYLIVKGVLRNNHQSGTYLLKSTAGHSAYGEQAPENEHLTTQIANRVFGISTYPNSIAYFNGKEIGYLTKKHCGLPDQQQILQCVHLCGEDQEVKHFLDQYVNAKAIMTEKLFKLVLFNYLTGNQLSISQCISLHKSPYGDYIISPASNLYNSTLHEEDTSRAPDHKTLNCLYKLGAEIGMEEHRITKMLRDFAGAEKQVKKLINSSFLDSSFKERYRDYFLSRAEIFTSLPAGKHT